MTKFCDKQFVVNKFSLRLQNCADTQICDEKNSNCDKNWNLDKNQHSNFEKKIQLLKN